METSRLTERQRPALEPMGDDEESRAIELARTTLGDGDYEVHGAEVRIDKPRRRGAVPDRRIGVVLAERGTNVVHEVLVDPRRDRVVDRTVVEGRILPFTQAEVDEAVAIAEADRDVGRLVRRKTTVRATFYPSQHAARPRKKRASGGGGRRVGVHYFAAARGGELRPLASVVVDLGAGTIASTTHHGDSRPQRSR